MLVLSPSLSLFFACFLIGTSCRATAREMTPYCVPHFQWTFCVFVFVCVVIACVRVWVHPKGECKRVASWHLTIIINRVTSLKVFFKVCVCSNCNYSSYTCMYNMFQFLLMIIETSLVSAYTAADVKKHMYTYITYVCLFHFTISVTLAAARNRATCKEQQ